MPTVYIDARRKRPKKPRPLKKGGRPQLAIDTNAITALSALGCTVEEIATSLGCSHHTLYKRFPEYIKKGRQQLKQSLRASQLSSAVDKGSVPMQIWLGKQYLGQADKVESTTTDTVAAKQQKLDMAELEAFRNAMSQALGNVPQELPNAPQLAQNVGTLEAEIVPTKALPEPGSN